MLPFITILTMQYIMQQEQEEYTLPPYPQYRFSFSQPHQYKASLLLIALPGPSAIFVRSLIPPQPVLNTLNYSRAKQSSLADLYCHNDILFLVFNDDPPKQTEYDISVLFTTSLCFNSCLVLMSMSKQMLDHGSQGCLYSISSSGWGNKPMGSTFEDVIEGIGAQVIIYGEMNGVGVECGVGVFGEYELRENDIESTYGGLRDRYGLVYRGEMREETKKYNRRREAKGLYV